MKATRRAVLAALAASAPAALLAPLSSVGAVARSRRWSLPAKQPYTVVENAWLPMRDGKRLAARLWIPDSAARRPVPVVWEYLPYRKRDDLRWRDDATAQNLAPYGIAFARVDVRGSGDSEGVLTDEYSSAELDDGVECIAWLARQPWSNGAVGMRGISWGGINALQIAARAPAALKAIMPMGCVDNRYLGDAHYIGGALAAENFKWGTYFKVDMAGPPDPAITGPDWLRAWRERLEAAPPILETWTTHQRFDDYWQRGSVAVDYAAIRCPVYVVSGWLDPYSNAVGSLLAGLRVPRKGLIGPWGHLMPNLPAPLALDWAHEEVRWWQHWLGGVETGLMDEPMFRAYLPYRTLSEVYPAALPGRWIAESSWPPAAVRPLVLHFDEGRLVPAVAARHVVSYVGDRIVGLAKPQWMPSRPDEQSADDARSLVFDSAPLPADLEILGNPVARVRVSADRPVAKLAVRLTEVHADGRSWLVSYGILNLTHRDSHELPTALEPGRAYDVEVPLYLTAHRFRQGSRLRIALSEGLWPLVWPSPAIVTLGITLGASCIELPVRTPPSAEAPFPIPVIRSPGSSRYSHMDMGPGAAGRMESPLSTTRIEAIDTTMQAQSSSSVEIHEGDPNSGVWRQENLTRWQRAGWDCTVSAAFELRSTPDEFQLREVLRATQGEAEIFLREQRSTIRRDLL